LPIAGHLSSIIVTASENPSSPLVICIGKIAVRILLLTPYYVPDLGPSAPLFTLLSERLVKHGHEVMVVTTVPHYPSGKVDTAYRGQWIRRSIENGVKVNRVWLPSVNRSNFALRLLQFFCYQIGALWAGFNQKYEVVIAANPALWVWLPFVYYVSLRHKPALFSVHDVYPDVGVTLGVFRNKFAIAMIASLERYCLKRAGIVRILSESFRPGLRNLGISDLKMALVYDWVDTDLIQPLPRDNHFSQEHDLKDRFVILYAGNIGLSQGLENVLAAAEQLAGQPEIHFLFVGDGPGREQLVTQAHAQKLTNVQFLPFQPRGRLPEVLASADVSLVVLRKGIGAGSLPSKTFSILASGRPILVSVDEHSETWNLIQKAQAGLCIEPENPAELAKAILALKNDPNLRERLGQNGRVWAERMHSPQSATIQFEELLDKTVDLMKFEGHPSN
jgi:colanic acid biosynthesis glycosyl transferase WcaI